MLKLIYSAVIAAVGPSRLPMSSSGGGAKGEIHNNRRKRRPEHTATKKEPTCRPARRARTSEAVRGGVEGAEGGRGKDQGHDLAEVLERLQHAAQVCFQVTCSLYFKARTQNRTHKMTKGIGETEISPTPSVSSKPGRPG